MAHGYLCQVCGHIMSYALNGRCIMCKGKSLQFCRDMRSEDVIDESLVIKRRHKPVAPRFAILNVALMITVISTVGAWISMEVGKLFNPHKETVELAGKNKPGL